jgi:hypothetical protein
MPRPSDHSKLPELAVLAIGMFLGLLVTTTYFIRVEPLVVTRINQTERITIECRAAGPPPPIMPCKEIAELAWWARMIISYLVAGTMLSILRLYGCHDLMDRLKKIEARIEHWGPPDVTRESVAKSPGSSLQ